MLPKTHCGRGLCATYKYSKKSSMYRDSWIGVEFFAL